jgi:glycosyltransferase involved in cell wall biosynthesis
MEYMALSKPVVATNVGGVNELVKNNKTGFLVDMEDHKEMSEKILFLLANKQKADKMGLAGKDIIQDEFSLTKMINSYITLYRRLNYSE